MEIVIDGLNRNLEKMNKSLEIKHTGEDRGRGFFAVKLIMKSEYVFEYNTTAVLNEKKNEELQREYELNNEASCTIEAKVQGKKMFFDATRHMDQFGRYINHVARGCNVQPHPPLFVCGKWRIGFYATTVRGRSCFGTMDAKTAKSPGCQLNTKIRSSKFQKLSVLQIEVKNMSASCPLYLQNCMLWPPHAESLLVVCTKSSESVSPLEHLFYH